MRSRDRLLKFAGFIAKVLPSSTRQAFYRNPVLANMIRNSLNLAAPEGMSEVVIAAGAAEDLQMQLDLKTEKDYWLGTYETDLQKGIIDLVNSGDIIYDIGANIGFLTLLFARETGPNGQVHAFEALPENVARLNHNVEKNEFQNWVTIVHAAVMDKSGLAEFLIGPSTGMGKVTGSAGRSSIEYQESILVAGISIDEYIEVSGNPPPDILKIDIEGGEVLALPGMQSLIHNHHPILMVELHGPEAAQFTWDRLMQEEYKICRMAPAFPEVKDLHELNWKSYIVALPND
jgi:FkbM family methyltransferase